MVDGHRAGRHLHVRFGARRASITFDYLDGFSPNSSHRTRTMVSSPIGFPTLGEAALVSTMESVSMRLVLREFATVLKLPNVFGTVSVTVKTVLEFRKPLIVYGIGVVLAYRSIDANLNGDPSAATRISPVTVVAGSAKNRMNGAGCPPVVLATHAPDAVETVKPDSE